jgi:hypothetical protein
MKNFIRSAAWQWTMGATAAWLPLHHAHADCPGVTDPIATDRPTFANSSSVVPAASLQFENGFGTTGGPNGPDFDLPETRARLGVGGCTEFLVDLPDDNWAANVHGAHGWSSVAPTIKHEFGFLPEGWTLSAAVGADLGTGAGQISGHGPAPYVQFPWSVDLGNGWSANGMYGATFHPDAPLRGPDHQTSFFLDRSVASNADVFAEFANDYQAGEQPLNRLSVGGSYRFTPTQQIDIKVGAGLNHAAPDYYLTVGYSVRFDCLFPTLNLPLRQRQP